MQIFSTILDKGDEADQVLLPLPSDVHAKKTKGFSLAIDTNIYYIKRCIYIFLAL